MFNSGITGTDTDIDNGPDDQGSPQQGTDLDEQSPLPIPSKNKDPGQVKKGGIFFIFRATIDMNRFYL